MLYHREVFWKQEFDELFKENLKHIESLSISQHLRLRAMSNEKRYDYNLNDVYNIFISIVRHPEKVYLFEVEWNDSELTKMVFRTEYDDNRDISIVLRNDECNNFKIITAWLNDKNDNHSTLDYSKYCEV